MLDEELEHFVSRKKGLQAKIPIGTRKSAKESGENERLPRGETNMGSLRREAIRKGQTKICHLRIGKGLKKRKLGS